MSKHRSENPGRVLAALVSVKLCPFYQHNTPQLDRTLGIWVITKIVVHLLGGQVQVFFGNGNMESSIEHIRHGRLRALAVTTSTRSALLPDIPTIAEFVPGYEASGWQGIGGPKNTPIDIVNRLNEEINAGLADPKVKSRLADLGGTSFVESPADFGKFIAEETEKWGKVVKVS